MPVCPHCGAPLELDMKFCTKCGANLQPESTTTSVTRPPSSTSTSVTKEFIEGELPDAWYIVIIIGSLVSYFVFDSPFNALGLGVCMFTIMSYLKKRR